MPRIGADTALMVAEAVGLEGLDGDVAAAAASDAEYHLRRVVQEALKFMRHARRSTLTTDDVNFALKLHGQEARGRSDLMPAGAG